MSTEPGRHVPAWRGRPGFVGASQLRAMKRNVRTARQYSGKVKYWYDFNEEGDGVGSYDPLFVTNDKFELFAGWLLGDAAAGVRGHSTDGDLNGFRSALNRHFAEHNLGRPLRDSVEVQQTIRDYDLLQVASKAKRGEEARLNRVPCPESWFVHLLHEGESSSVDAVTLCWIGTLFVQILGWLRGNSVGGFGEGEVAFDLRNYLLISVRVMKMRPQFLVQPGLIAIPPGPTATHVRSRVLAVIRRAFRADRLFYLVVARAQDPVTVAAGSDRSSAIITARMRSMFSDFVASLPKGQIVACHSWREMAAVACFHAHYDSTRMAAHGFWESIGTMYSAYIKPYQTAFPYCRWLAELFDFLRAA
mgnify:CR=1 FL=1